MTPRTTAHHTGGSKTKSKAKAASQKPETFFDILKEDHEKVMDLFEQVEKNKEMEEVGDIFAQIGQELESHMKLEESYFYPALEENDETHDKALEAYEEHHVTKVVLNELKGLGQDDETWKAKLKVLKELVQHHVQEEETNIFKAAKKALDKDQIQEITDSIEEEKERVHAHA